MSNTAFALLGFLPDVEVRLKELIEEGVAVPVNWVTATDSSLEGVVINANFLSSPQIQKYIQNVKARVVCCYRDVDGLQQSKLHNIPGLHLDGYTRSNDEVFREWLGYLSGRIEQVPTTEADFDEEAYLSQQMQEISDFQPKNESITEQAAESTPPRQDPTPTPVVEKAVPQQKVETQSETPRQAVVQESTQPVARQSARPEPTVKQTEQVRETQSTSKNLSSDSQALLEKLKESEIYLQVQSGNKKSWIDTKRKQVYIDYPRDSIPGIDTMQWSECEAPNLSSLGSVRRVQMDLWLFEAVWQSSLDGSGEVTSSDHYKLSRWPRPLSADGRSEALRMAAFAQTVPVSVKELQEKTDYDESVVRRFIFATLCSGQMRVATQSELPKADNTIRSQRKPDKVKLGLLGRIRSKLGLG